MAPTAGDAHAMALSPSQTHQPAAAEARSTDTVCYLLDKVPSELRNQIYELLFPSSVGTKVELEDIEPPEKALISTCKKIYAEAHNMYVAAHRSLWSETHFIMSLDSGALFGPPMSLVADRYIQMINREHGAVDLSHLTHLELRTKCKIATGGAEPGEWGLTSTRPVPPGFGRNDIPTKCVLVPANKETAVKSRGFGLVKRQGLHSLKVCMLSDNLLPHDLELLKGIIGKPVGNRWEEAQILLRWLVHDGVFSYD